LFFSFLRKLSPCAQSQGLSRKTTKARFCDFAQNDKAAVVVIPAKAGIQVCVTKKNGFVADLNEK
jgi:hypothetical protein